MQTKARIEMEMRSAIDRSFTYDLMQKLAHTYVDEKKTESFYFGNLCVFHYEMFDGDTEGEIYKAAAALELMILSSDILDDIQDQDSPSKPWMTTPQPLALNAAYGLLMLGQKLLQECQMEPVRLQLAVDYVNQQILVSLNGQMQDVANDVNSIEDYMEMVRAKSSSLIAMACTLGVILATGKRNETVEQYALHIGLMAQLANDLNDYTLASEKSDQSRDLLTLPKLYNLSETLADDPAERYRQYEENGTFIYMQVMIRTHYYNCMESFDTLPQATEWRERFMHFVDGISA